MSMTCNISEQKELQFFPPGGNHEGGTIEDELVPNEKCILCL